ncbi:MAG: hypothetical protein D5S00_03045 [Tindallia sp. MSAO_Bac2]|nr:MAG: hypothetical protein D5S00_03045 [Tindallia sp. MSAO_Bac2]
MVKKRLKTNILILLIIISMLASVVSVFAGYEHTDPDDDEYTFIENIHAPGYEHVYEMADSVTIRRAGDGTLQSITFQVSSTGGHSARTYRTESFYVVNN